MKTNSASVPDSRWMPKYFHLIMVFSLHKHSSNVVWVFWLNDTNSNYCYSTAMTRISLFSSFNNNSDISMHIYWAQCFIQLYCTEMPHQPSVHSLLLCSLRCQWNSFIPLPHFIALLNNVFIHLLSDSSTPRLPVFGCRSFQNERLNVVAQTTHYPFGETLYSWMRTQRGQKHHRRALPWWPHTTGTFSQGNVIINKLLLSVSLAIWPASCLSEWGLWFPTPLLISHQVIFICQSVFCRCSAILFEIRASEQKM